jgi:hypothetical protein
MIPLQAITRRHFFTSAGFGIGSLALASLLNQNLFAAPQTVNPLAAKPTHYPARIKNVIFLFMAGGPSQLEMFDPKPKLNELHGTKCPEEVFKGERFAFIRGTPTLFGGVYKFARHGRSGMEVSELLPHTAAIADDLCLIRSMHTDQFNHAPAQIFMNTGHQVPGRPSMGSWLTYGLGTENAELPGFIVLLSGLNAPDGGKSCWGSGFLPTVYQGVEFRSRGEPVLFVTNPSGVNPEHRRSSLDALRDLNQSHLDDVGDPEISTRINAYEMAYRMQSSVPELTDLTSEPKHIHDLYGTEPGKTSFANNCLLARRLVERGVRFVQLYHRGWDHHGDNPLTSLALNLPQRCREVDRASAALVTDLKQRGLLDETLVIWGGEFGRTPMREVRGQALPGRDHHARSFSYWLAGGGIKKGHIHGRTDDLGYAVVEDPVHVHDLHATILHLMGLDHTKLTYRFQGRDFRLTDVHGKLVRGILA